MLRCLAAMLSFGASVAVTTASAQAPTRAVSVLTPDTVRVGEPFTLGVFLESPPEADVAFPSLLSLGPELEQLRPPNVSRNDVAGGSRARYRLVAWKAGRWDIPDIVLEWDGGRVVIAPPSVEVTSVLPAEAETPLQLRPPRGPIAWHPFPWWLLLLLLALAALWWLLRRLRGPLVNEEAPIDAGVEARAALAELRQGLEAGLLGLEAFYDGVEAVLRRYLVATKGWPDERPVREFVDAAAAGTARPDLVAGLRSMRDRAGLVRFAHVATAVPAALVDVDTCVAWVDAEEAA